MLVTRNALAIGRAPAGGTLMEDHTALVSPTA
jgi:hypothetical protein